jgi:hypothetical protein
MDSATVALSSGGQIEQRHDHDPGDHHQQRRRHRGRDPFGAEQRGQAGQPDGGRPGVDVAEP